MMDALGPWSPYLIFILCHQPFCQLYKKVILRLSEHGRRQQQNANGVFGYTSVILAPFKTVFGYFWLKKSGDPDLKQHVVWNCVKMSMIGSIVLL